MASSLSSPSGTSSSSDVTQCPVCSEDFSQEKNTPKFLPCAHVVCRECLATRIKQPRATCPVCQGRFLTLSDLDPNTLNDLDPNYDAERSTEKIPTDQAARALANATKLLREEPECSACGYVIGVTSYCFHCRMKLCRKCADMHPKFPAFQTHKVHPLGELSAHRLALGGHATCRQHPDRSAELFCPAHCRPICIACVPDHTKCGGVQVLQEAAEDERERLDVWAQRLLLAGTDMQDKAAHLEKQRDESKQNFQHLRDTVTKRINILHEALESRKRHLLSLIQNQETQLAESVSSQLLPLKELSPLLLSHGEAGKRVVSAASDGDLLEMAAEILLPRWKELEMRSSDDVTREFRHRKVLTVDETVFEDLKSRIIRLGFVSEDRGSASNEAFAAASGIATFCAEDEKIQGWIA